MTERLNREIRQITRSVGISPNMDSCIRLVSSCLIEYSEDWSTPISYTDSKVQDTVSTERSGVA